MSNGDLVDFRSEAGLEGIAFGDHDSFIVEVRRLFDRSAGERSDDNVSLEQLAELDESYRWANS